jgi:hypothetical protein
VPLAGPLLLCFLTRWLGQANTNSLIALTLH